MDSPIKLIIATIIAIIIIFTIYNYFTEQTKQAGKDIKAGIKYAESNLNTTSTKQIKFTKGEAYNAKVFEEPGTNVRFECTSTEACIGDKLKITTKQIQALQDYYINAHFRCTDKKIMNDCIVYFGDEPAKLEIQKVKAPEETTKNDETEIEFTITNKGKIPTAKIEYEIKVFVETKKETEKQNILKQNYQGTIEKLEPQEEKTIKQKINYNSSGKSYLEITAQSENAGIATTKKEILVKESFTDCKATTKGKPILIEGKCKTPYYCENCEFAYECSLKWTEQGIKATEIYKEVVYEEKEPENGECK
ncbi:MAG: hypothetical protein QXU92_02660 [Candidatus Diapherotrites archaeon]